MRSISYHPDSSQAVIDDSREGEGIKDTSNEIEVSFFA